LNSGHLEVADRFVHAQAEGVFDAKGDAIARTSATAVINRSR
jgi:hypothetical protein